VIDAKKLNAFGRINGKQYIPLIYTIYKYYPLLPLLSKNENGSKTLSNSKTIIYYYFS
jgi:hypothetical protein